MEWYMVDKLNGLFGKINLNSKLVGINSFKKFFDSINEFDL